MYRKILSEENKKIKLLSSLSQKKHRYANKIFFVEGFKVIEESLDYMIPECLVVNENKVDLFKFLEDKRLIDCEILIVNDKIFNKLSDTNNAQGIIGYYKFVHKCIDDKFLRGSYILLDGVTDPGNLGGIIRTAEGFGFSGVIIGPNCVDLYNPKALRSTMASIFRVNIYTIDDYNHIKNLINNGFTLMATTIIDSKNIYDIDFKEDFIIAIGNEARGLGIEILSLAQEHIHIPMEDSINSLNANVAASIIMYEAFRQKRIKS